MMNNRISRLESRALALSKRNAEPLLEVPAADGTARMTVEQFNAAGGIWALGPCWKNPGDITLKTARKFLAAVPSAIE